MSMVALSLDLHDRFTNASNAELREYLSARGKQFPKSATKDILQHLCREEAKAASQRHRAEAMTRALDVLRGLSFAYTPAQAVGLLTETIEDVQRLADGLGIANGEIHAMRRQIVDEAFREAQS